jgi:cysteine desulfurase/selenocysteine lyase
VVNAQKPRQVLDALRAFYESSYTNVHRGAYLLAKRGSERFEGSREMVRAFINACGCAKTQVGRGSEPFCRRTLVSAVHRLSVTCRC